ncbi:MAG: 3'(2'),5'-bisphosphate nucleotidase CysQ, partial [Betaproteobacteria bacterium]
MNRAELLECVIDTARAAGRVILAVYGTDFEIRSKADASPLTEADEKSEAIIRSGLKSLSPGVPIVSEEAASAASVPQVAGQFWLVDPLDGTKEFIARNGEFTINIALIEHCRPVLGVIFAPALDRLYAGAEGVGAFVE